MKLGNKKRNILELMQNLSAYIIIGNLIISTFSTLSTQMFEFYYSERNCFTTKVHSIASIHYSFNLHTQSFCMTNTKNGLSIHRDFRAFRLYLYYFSPPFPRLADRVVAPSDRHLPNQIHPQFRRTNTYHQPPKQSLECC